MQSFTDPQGPEGDRPSEVGSPKRDFLAYHNTVTKKKLSYEGKIDQDGKQFSRTEQPPSSTYIWTESPEAPGSEFYVLQMRELREELQGLSNFENKLSLLHPQDDILETGGSDRWWENDSIGETVLKQLHSMKIRYIPLSATLDEVLSVLRQAVADVGSLLWDAYVFLFGKRMARESQRAAPPEELSVAVHYQFIHLRKDWNGDLTYGNNVKLTRLKFQGGCRQILLLQLSYEQQDRAYRWLSRGEDGDLTAEEWVTALARPDGVSVLFEEDDRSLNDVRTIRKSLDIVCMALERSGMTLTEYFESFDRDSSGRISIAEFATMMRNLQRTIISDTELKRSCDVESLDADNILSMTPLTQRHMYLLMRMMDRDFSRTIDLEEFLSFFKTIWSKRLNELEEKEREVLSVAGLQERAYINEYYLYSLQEKIRMIKRILFKTYGRKAIEAPEVALKTLPGPYAAVLNKMDMLPKEVKPILADTYYGEGQSPSDQRRLFRPNTAQRRKVPSRAGSSGHRDESKDGVLRSAARPPIRSIRFNKKKSGGADGGDLEPLDPVGEETEDLEAASRPESVAVDHSLRDSEIAPPFIESALSEEEDGMDTRETVDRGVSQPAAVTGSETRDFFSSFTMDPESEEEESEEEEPDIPELHVFPGGSVGAPEEWDLSEEDDGAEDGEQSPSFPFPHSPQSVRTNEPQEESPPPDLPDSPDAWGEEAMDMVSTYVDRPRNQSVDRAGVQESKSLVPEEGEVERDEEDPSEEVERDEGKEPTRPVSESKNSCLESGPKKAPSRRRKGCRLPTTVRPISYHGADLRPSPRPAALKDSVHRPPTAIGSSTRPVSVAPVASSDLSSVPFQRRRLTNEEIRAVNDRLSRKGRNELRIFKLNPNKYSTPLSSFRSRAPHSRARAEAKGPGGIEAAHIPFQVTIGGPDLFLIPDFASGRVPGTYE